MLRNTLKPSTINAGFAWIGPRVRPPPTQEKNEEPEAFQVLKNPLNKKLPGLERKAFKVVVDDGKFR